MGGRWEGGSGWGTPVHLWWIHVDVWQNQYNIVKLKNKIKRNLEKAMATHSSILAWRIPGTEEPSGLPSMGSHRVRHD